MALSDLAPRARRVRHDDSGQLILLIALFALIVTVLITVVVNATKIYLTQTSLYAASDAAAAAAANAIDPAAVTGGQLNDVLPLNERDVRDRVIAYAQDADLTAKFHDFRVLGVSTSGRSVTVRFGARVKMPFSSLVSDDSHAGYAISSRSSAAARVGD